MSRVLGSKFIKYGAPFLILVVGGSLGLKEFVQIRYDHRQQLRITPEEAKTLGVTMRPRGDVTLDTEFQKMKKEDISSWTNIRGPRPWEEAHK
jgi:cytochrome c oxidase assembly protein subunit 16